MLSWIKSKMTDTSSSSFSFSSSDDDNPAGEIKCNMNSSLKSLFTETTDESSDKSSDKASDESAPRCDWEPPRTHGLRNSFPVLQQIHVRKLQCGEKLDYYDILKEEYASSH